MTRTLVDSRAVYRASEQDEQEALFDAIRLHTGRYPVLEMAFHVANEGRHSVAYRAKMARQGVKAGIPDLLLPVPQGRWHGLALELKVGRNQPSAAQVWWLDHLTAFGWHASVCRGWEAAWDTIIAYCERTL